MAKAINLAEKLSQFSEHFQPRTVEGRLTIRMHEGDVALGPGEMFVVPKGVQHCPVAEEEVHLLLIEPTGTPNTGDRASAAPRRVI
jgi:mannose-6-phosphate isomerase-like protein (cupin superfamily)